jgi:hypothetical protein
VVLLVELPVEPLVELPVELLGEQAAPLVLPLALAVWARPARQPEERVVRLAVSRPVGVPV